jgi:hypothetical protein
MLPRVAYDQFTLDDVKRKLGLTVREVEGAFADVPPIAASAWLTETLQEGSALALSYATEKARSEWIIAPVLLELRRQRRGELAVFSGAEFDVDPTRGLTGFCDWIVTRSPELFAIEAPVIAVVEAKNENFRQGVPQCIAEMYAARIFNERRERPRRFVYGVVTTGDIWRFLRMEGDVVTLDVSAYYLRDLDRVLGVLRAMTAPETSPGVELAAPARDG